MPLDFNELAELVQEADCEAAAEQCKLLKVSVSPSTFSNVLATMPNAARGYLEPTSPNRIRFLCVGGTVDVVVDPGYTGDYMGLHVTTY
jgi:hypothetical protein